MNNVMESGLEARLAEIKRDHLDPLLEEIRKRNEGYVWDKSYRAKVNSYTRMGSIEASISVLHDYVVLLHDKNIQQDEEQGLKIHELEQLVKQEQEKRVRQSLRIIELEHRIKKLEEEKDA